MQKHQHINGRYNVFSLFLHLGVGIGFVLPPIFTSKASDIPFMLLIEAAIVSVACIPILFCK